MTTAPSVSPGAPVSRDSFRRLPTRGRNRLAVGASPAVQFTRRPTGHARAVAQFGSAPVWGAGGRRFKSGQPDRYDIPAEICSMVVVGRPSYGSYVSAIPQSSPPLRRTWTDEQLKDVVARERSWRAVAQALGLRPTSTIAVRRHAARLQLDTSHFTGQRPWSDGALIRAVRDGTSWAHVLRILGVNNNGDSMSRIRGHAARLDLDVSHLDRSRRQQRAATGVAPPRSEQLRTAATSIAAAWFALRGYCTALPTEPQVYDLLVEFPEGIRRIQVKSTTCRVRNGRWQVQVGRRPYAPGNASARSPYDPEALDYFFIVSGDGALYLIPSQLLAGRVGVYVDSYADLRVGDASSLLT